MKFNEGSFHQLNWKMVRDLTSILHYSSTGMIAEVLL